MINFSAAKSEDSDGEIVSYAWDFGVGRAELEVYYSEFAEHIYNRPNKYNITLIVEDDKYTTVF